MSPMPDPTVQLRPFQGSITRERPILELKGGPWAGVVKITPLTGAQGAQAAELRYEVSASWHGPPMLGFAPAPGGADSTDTIMVGDLELAKAIAMAAIDELRRPEVPELHALARRFRAR